MSEKIGNDASKKQSSQSKVIRPAVYRAASLAQGHILQIPRTGKSVGMSSAGQAHVPAYQMYTIYAQPTLVLVNERDGKKKNRHVFAKSNNIIRIRISSGKAKVRPGLRPCYTACRERGRERER